MDRGETRTEHLSGWAVFLDRDGVVTEAPILDGVAGSPLKESDLRVADGAPEALDRLATAGASLILVTNQPDVARGKLDPAELDRMHQRLARDLPLDLLVVCPHSGHEGCSCRKPKPGMIISGASRCLASLELSWMVGDRWVDIAAGRSAGVATVLIERPYSWTNTSSGAPPPDLHPDHRARDLSGATDLILAHRQRSAPADLPVLPANVSDLPRE